MIKLKSAITQILIFVLALNLFISCKEYHRNKLHPEISNAAISRGEALAVKYCQSCHLLPDPNLLDAKTWEEGVLPVMGPYLGIFSHYFQKYPNAKRDLNLDSNFYPSKPLLTIEEWQNIIDYYIATSPDSLKQPERNTVVTSHLPGFQFVPTAFKVASPTNSYIKIDTATHQLLLADLFTQYLYRFDSKLNLQDSVNTKSAIVDIEYSNNEM